MAFNSERPEFVSGRPTSPQGMPSEIFKIRLLNEGVVRESEGGHVHVQTSLTMHVKEFTMPFSGIAGITAEARLAKINSRNGGRPRTNTRVKP